MDINPLDLLVGHAILPWTTHSLGCSYAVHLLVPICFNPSWAGLIIKTIKMRSMALRMLWNLEGTWPARLRRIQMTFCVLLISLRVCDMGYLAFICFCLFFLFLNSTHPFQTSSPECLPPYSLSECLAYPDTMGHGRPLNFQPGEMELLNSN